MEKIMAQEGAAENGMAEEGTVERGDMAESAMGEQGVSQSEKSKGPAASLWEWTALNRKRYGLSIILAVLGVAAGLTPYFSVAQMVIQLIGGGRELSYYVFWCVIAAVGYVAQVVFSNWSTSVSHAATFVTLKEIRKKMVSKLSRMPMGRLLDTPSGKFKDTIVDRVEGLETTLAHLVPEMTANILVPILLIVYLFILDWRMALVSLITLPIGMCFMMAISKSYPAQYAGSVEASKQMNNTVVEYVNGIEVIKAFNQSATSYEKYTNAVNYNAAYFYKWMKSCQWPMAAYTAICPATLVTVLPIGFLFYASGSLTGFDFITIIILSLGIVGPLLAASSFVDNVAMMGTVVQQVEDILAAPELIRPQQAVELNDLTIETEHLSFSYHEDSKQVLKDVNLTIEPGTVTALVGPSGSGKSTISKLIAGFWDVTDGRISVGGIDIRSIPQRQLAQQIAYVAQDNYLFDDTICENIRMGRKSASDTEVERAAKDAKCDTFIRGLENGYDTRVGGAGGHLSGGERQRVAIARALLKDAPIVILDEATAYIDPENEAILQEAVGRLVAGKTLIVIAHRLSTITDSDQIVVMEDGGISAKGTHDELLRIAPLYREMWQAHIGSKDGEEND